MISSSEVIYIKFMRVFIRDFLQLSEIDEIEFLKLFVKIINKLEKARECWNRNQCSYRQFSK